LGAALVNHSRFKPSARDESANASCKVALCNPVGYNPIMIKTFAHKGLERFFTTGSQAGIQAIHGKRLRLVLALLNDAAEIDDIDAPALRLHPLKGDLAGFWAVTIQANWRVIFRFENGDAHVVDYVDHH
jgi:toxin HigB-1